MTNIKNITIDQGSTYAYTFTLLDTDGAVFDLSGFTARAQVRRSYGNTSAIIDATTENAQLVIALNTIIWFFTPDETKGIKFANKEDDTLEAFYDLEIVSSLGKVYKPSKGTFIINREITR
jgi:hypothetical protein